MKGKKKIISLSLRAPPLPPFQTLSQVHPTALMLLEGTGQLGTVAMNWGDGFATDAAVVEAQAPEGALLLGMRVALRA